MPFQLQTYFAVAFLKFRAGGKKVYIYSFLLLLFTYFYLPMKHVTDLYFGGRRNKSVFPRGILPPHKKKTV